MSSLSAAGSGSSNRPDSTPPTGATTTAVHPLLRTTLRYTLSAKEYKLLHDYLVKRSPTAVQKRFVSPQRYEALYHSSSPPSGRSGDGKSSSRGGDDYNAAAVRAALRVFLAASAGLKAWDVISGRLAGKAAAKTKYVPVSILLPQQALEILSSSSILSSPFVHSSPNQSI